MAGKVNYTDPIARLIGQLNATPAKTAPAAPKPSMGADTYKPTGRVAKYAIEADLVTSRLYVIDKATGKPVDRYLISPGTKQYPTQGDHFTIQRALDKAPWIPPASTWAAGAQQVPGGENNPMGIFKMDLGGFAQYIHGTPANERKDLGHPASHGCMRMSNENVLQLFERYAGVGTEVNINRDPARSQQLRDAFRAEHGRTHKITDGAELLPAAIAGHAPTTVDEKK